MSGFVITMLLLGVIRRREALMAWLAMCPCRQCQEEPSTHEGLARGRVIRRILALLMLVMLPLVAQGIATGGASFEWVGLAFAACMGSSTFVLGGLAGAWLSYMLLRKCESTLMGGAGRVTALTVGMFITALIIIPDCTRWYTKHAKFIHDHTGAWTMLVGVLLGYYAGRRLMRRRGGE
jgi:hypothetical protein